MGQILQTSRGRQLELENRIARGGEGAVFAVKGEPDVVAKLYKAEVLLKRGPQLPEKIAAMCERRPKEPDPAHLSIAWPIESLSDQSGFVGYLMARVSDAAPILLFQTGPACRKEFPGFNHQHAFRAAANLAAAVELIHHVGHVIGDFNHKNVLCRPNGLVTIIDTDSFHIKRADGRVYPCGVAVPEYVAPEIQQVERSKISWSTEHDVFALAVHAFELILRIHPFAGVLLQRGDAEKLHLQLLNSGVFPYIANPVAKAPPGFQKQFDALSSEVREAFIRAFVHGFAAPDLRPKASEWQRLLAYEHDRLVECAGCRDFISPDAPECPYCSAGWPLWTTARLWYERAEEAARARPLLAGVLAGATLLGAGWLISGKGMPAQRTALSPAVAAVSTPSKRIPAKPLTARPTATPLKKIPSKATPEITPSRRSTRATPLAPRGGKAVP